MNGYYQLPNDRETRRSSTPGLSNRNNSFRPTKDMEAERQLDRIKRLLEPIVERMESHGTEYYIEPAVRVDLLKTDNLMPKRKRIPQLHGIVSETVEQMKAMSISSFEDRVLGIKVTLL